MIQPSKILGPVGIILASVGLAASLGRGLFDAYAAGPVLLGHPIAATGNDRRPERMDDPPTPDDFLRRQAEAPHGLARRGPFTSIQVNVNASQNNIVGDAANESSIAISPADPSQI